MIDDRKQALRPRLGSGRDGTVVAALALLLAALPLAAQDEMDGHRVTTITFQGVAVMGDAVDTASARIRSMLRDRGHVDVVVQDSSIVSGTLNTVRLRILVSPGPAAMVGDLVVRGYREVSTTTIRRIVDLEPGSPLRQRDLDDAQRQADALAFLAERAMEWGGDAGGGKVASGSLAERYQVMVHVAVGTLGEGASNGESDSVRERSSIGSDPAAPALAPAHVGAAASSLDPHRSEVEPGIRVSAEPRSARRRQTSRRLCCDAGVVTVTQAPDGSVLDVGRRTRTIPPALRRALEVRDRGCRFPGCHSRFCEAHHIRHWAAGGETSLANTLLLCRYHHRLRHEGRWTLALNPAAARIP